MKDYKKILEGVVDIINTTEKSDIGFANICTYIGENCPELAESKNERIRKRIIDALHGDVLEMSEIKEAVAWLEKQGNLMKALQISNAEIGELIEKNYYLKEQLEKQSEQKPTDKIKPKFKVVDIVKHKDNPHLTYILKRFTDDGDYEFHAIGKDGNEGCTCFSVVKYQDEWELVEEPVSEDLGEYIDKLSKQFPEVSFAKLSRIVVRVAKWQEQKYKEVLNIYLNSQWNKGK